MEFKIDTKPTYTVITPVDARIDANMTAALGQKCEELATSGTSNYIIDLQHCTSGDNTSFDDLVQMHENCYNNSQSLVFTGLQNGVMQQLQELELDNVLNIAPQMIEAIDIISMEILERDLFNEEE
ncbi:MAG: STAS domain-containing protein [Flavipsychrobacter sp.]|nr:STAS domain-containing protein [Flavipsychrobacter sp.]